jgi:hypothetical protein
MPEDQAQQSAQVGSQQPVSGVAASTQDQAAQPAPGTASDSAKVREFLTSLNDAELGDFRKMVRDMTSPAFDDQNTKFQKRITDAEKRASRAERTAAELADEETRAAYTMGADLMDTFKSIADRLGVPGTRWINRPQDLQVALTEHLSANSALTGNGQPASQEQPADAIDAAVQQRLALMGFRPPGGAGLTREPLIPSQAGSGLNAADADRDFLVRFGNGQIPMTKENMARMNALTGADKPLIQQ